MEKRLQVLSEENQLKAFLKVLKPFFRHYSAQVHEFSVLQRSGSKLHHYQSIQLPARRIEDQTFHNYYRKINAAYCRHWPFMPFS